MDKAVDKLRLTPRKARIGAGFNKMHNPKAKIKFNKINQLAKHPGMFTDNAIGIFLQPRKAGDKSENAARCAENSFDKRRRLT